MTDYLPLLAGLIALLAGLTIGKAWERYKLRDGKWIDRRRARESPHYILGLNFVVANQIDLAIEELSKAADALVNLQKLHEDQHQWSEAYDTRQRLSKLADHDERPQNQAILAFLENEIGLEAMRRKDYAEAIRRFQAAIDLDARAVPAYLNLGDVRVADGNDKDAAAIWEKLVEVAPDRAYLAFDRLEALALRTGSPERFTRLCRRLIDDNPQDWRARLALSRHLAASGRPHDALDLLFAALVQNPHALGIHQAIWRALGQLRHEPSLVDRYSELTRHAVFYLDPHVCLRCRYRSTELLWQCPHCHDWNTFVEERIAPAQDTTEVEV